jgi:hypothetical protein
MTDFAELCMADYDENGWLDPDYFDGGDGTALDRD